MSRNGRQLLPRESAPAPVRTAQLSDTVVTRPMLLSGIVKTSNGYATAIAELSADGKTVVKVELGRSQAYKECIAREHLREVSRLGQKV